MKVIMSRDVSFNEDALYKDDLAIALSKSKWSQKAVFEELNVADVLQPETCESLEKVGVMERQKILKSMGVLMTMKTQKPKSQIS